MNLNVSGVHPWEGKQIRAQISTDQRQGGASERQWDGIQEMWDLLAWPATSLPLTCCVALGQSLWAPISFSTICTFRNLLRKVRNLLRKWSTSREKVFVNISVVWRRSPICLSVPVHSLQRKIQLFREKYFQFLLGHRRSLSMCCTWCFGTEIFLEAPGCRFYYSTANSRHGTEPLLQ